MNKKNMIKGLLITAAVTTLIAMSISMTNAGKPLGEAKESAKSKVSFVKPETTKDILVKPSHEPVVKPSIVPPVKPSHEPGVKPSIVPPVKPSFEPGVKPSIVPPVKPSCEPEKKIIKE